MLSEFKTTFSCFTGGHCGLMIPFLKIYQRGVPQSDRGHRGFRPFFIAFFVPYIRDIDIFKILCKVVLLTHVY